MCLFTPSHQLRKLSREKIKAILLENNFSNNIALKFYQNRIDGKEFDDMDISDFRCFCFISFGSMNNDKECYNFLRIRDKILFDCLPYERMNHHELFCCLVRHGALRIGELTSMHKHMVTGAQFAKWTKEDFVKVGLDFLDLNQILKHRDNLLLPLHQPSATNLEGGNGNKKKKYTN